MNYYVAQANHELLILRLLLQNTRIIDEHKAPGNTVLFCFWNRQ